MKVLAPRRDEALPWTSIEVVRGEAGVSLALHDEAAQLAQRAHLAAFAVSLTHESEYAAAVVIAGD